MGDRGVDDLDVIGGGVAARVACSDRPEQPRRVTQSPGVADAVRRR
jgi:hypothetical protein